MEHLTTALITIFFVILPAIAIYGFTSSVTEGVYNWSKNQKPLRQRVPTKDYDTEQEIRYRESLEEEYFGHPSDIEDSVELKEVLDRIDFDFRRLMNKTTRKDQIDD